MRSGISLWFSLFPVRLINCVTHLTTVFLPRDDTRDVYEAMEE